MLPRQCDLPLVQVYPDPIFVELAKYVRLEGEDFWTNSGVADNRRHADLQEASHAVREIPGVMIREGKRPGL